ncbi:MAG: tripartite tricarboxylate transporter substrate-binding protein [Dehalococcoidia bacterium]|nr:tripartite tricarboxylate transporter substrate-binding protein [Dehalococcoidia bacterium]
MKRVLLVALMAVLVLGLLLAGCAQPAPAPTTAPAPAPKPAPAPAKPGPEEFYKGKTLELYVPSSPGSGLDTTARLLAPVMQQEIGATVVVINQPGGGYTIPINYLYEKAEPDGLRIALMEGSSTIAAQLLVMENCRYDLRKMSMIYNVSSGDGICVVASDSPYQSVSDLLAAKKTLVAAATGPTTPTGMAAKVILEVAFGLTVKVVTGYDAAPATYKAVLQKEADICLGLYSAAAGLISERKLKPLFVWQRERFKRLPDVPTAFEALEKAGKLTPESKYWIDVIVELNTIQKALMTSQNVPADRIKFLRDTMGKILKQQAVVDSFDKATVTLYPLSGEETAKSVSKLLDMEKSKAEQLKKLLLTK